jgi:hypothetical protein
MSMANEYATILNERPHRSQDSPSIEELRKFCDGITEYTQPQGHCKLERGFLVNVGQEFRVTLIRADNQYKLILLRAYVPSNDLPVLLDTYGDEMVKCNSLKDLKEALGQFLRREDIQTQIQDWIR